MTIEQYYGERVTDKDWKEWIEEELWTDKKAPDKYGINEVYEKLAQVEDDIENGDLIIAPRSKWLLCVWKNSLDNPKYFIHEVKPYLINIDDKWCAVVDEDTMRDVAVVVAVFDTEKEAIDALQAIKGA